MAGDAGLAEEGAMNDRDSQPVMILPMEALHDGPFCVTGRSMTYRSFANDPHYSAYSLSRYEGIT